MLLLKSFLHKLACFNSHILPTLNFVLSLKPLTINTVKIPHGLNLALYVPDVISSAYLVILTSNSTRFFTIIICPFIIKT